MNTVTFGIMVILEYKKIIRNNVRFSIVCGWAVITGLVLSAVVRWLLFVYCVLGRWLMVGYCVWWGSDNWFGIVWVGAVMADLVLCVIGCDYLFGIVWSGAVITGWV